MNSCVAYSFLMSLLLSNFYYVSLSAMQKDDVPSNATSTNEKKRFLVKQEGFKNLKDDHNVSSAASKKTDSSKGLQREDSIKDFDIINSGSSPKQGPYLVRQSVRQYALMQSAERHIANDSDSSSTTTPKNSPSPTRLLLRQNSKEFSSANSSRKGSYIQGSPSSSPRKPIITAHSSPRRAAFVLALSRFEGEKDVSPRTKAAIEHIFKLNSHVTSQSPERNPNSQNFNALGLEQGEFTTAEAFLKQKEVKQKAVRQRLKRTNTIS